MKLTVRTLAFASAAVGLMTAAHAQLQFEIRKSDGTAIPGGVLDIDGPGTNFGVQVWLRNTGNSAVLLNNINVMLGFSATNSSGTAAPRLDTIVSGALVGGSPDNSTLINPTLVPSGSASYRGAGATTGNNPLGTSRPWGNYRTAAAVAGSGGYSIAAGDAVPIFAYALINTGLNFGQTYGDDAGEAGVIVYDANNPATSLGNSWVTLQGATARTPVSGARIQLRAVPEPATMLVLGAGLAALAARRRRK